LQSVQFYTDATPREGFNRCSGLEYERRVSLPSSYLGTQNGNPGLTFIPFHCADTAAPQGDWQLSVESGENIKTS